MGVVKGDARSLDYGSDVGGESGLRATGSCIGGSGSVRSSGLRVEGLKGHAIRSGMMFRGVISRRLLSS